MSLKRIFKYLSFLSLLSILSPVAWAAKAAPAESDRFKVGSQSWDAYTNKDGTGLYWDILNQLFGSEQSIISHQALSLVEGIEAIKKEELKIYLGVYRSPSKEAAVLFPNIRLDNTITSLIFKKSTDYQGFNSLANKNVGAVAQLPPLDFLPEGLKLKKAPLKVLMARLKNNDLDYVIAPKYGTLLELQKQKQLLTDYQQIDVAFTPIYMVFTKSEAGEKLKKEFEIGMKKLYDSGKLKAYFEKYDSLDSFHFPEFDKVES